MHVVTHANSLQIHRQPFSPFTKPRLVHHLIHFKGGEGGGAETHCRTRTWHRAPRVPLDLSWFNLGEKEPALLIEV